MSETSWQIMICEPTKLGRSRLESILRSAKADAVIDSVANVTQLRERLKTQAWDIVFFDPDTDPGPLLDLLSGVRSFLVAVGGKRTESALHRLAEARVSYFIARPYPPEKILTCLEGFASFKSSYFDLISKARELIDSGDLRLAREHLESAQALRETPLEAWFYLARVAFREGRLEQAAQLLERCLEVDPLHYECLRESFEVFMEMKDYPRAFERGKVLLWNFHRPEAVISRTLRLAVFLKAFDEIPQLEAAASTQESGDVLNHLGSALFVSGKHYLLTAQTPEALRCFKLLAPLGDRYPKFLRATIFALARFGLREEAFEYLRRIKKEETVTVEICSFVLSTSSTHDENYRRKGRELFELYGGEDLQDYLERLEGR